MPKGRILKESQNLLFNREFNMARNLTNIISIVKPLSILQTLLEIGESTLEGNNINVVFVAWALMQT